MKWTDELLREEALKYDTRIYFQKGILDEVCSHMI